MSDTLISFQHEEVEALKYIVALYLICDYVQHFDVNTHDHAFRNTKYTKLPAFLHLNQNFGFKNECSRSAIIMKVFANTIINDFHEVFDNI